DGMPRSGPAAGSRPPWESCRGSPSTSPPYSEPSGRPVTSHWKSMKTAARRASRRLIALLDTLERLHRHVDRLDLHLAHPRERVGHPLLHRRRRLGEDTAVRDGELKIGASAAVLDLHA